MYVKKAFLDSSICFEESVTGMKNMCQDLATTIFNKFREQKGAIVIRPRKQLGGGDSAIVGKEWLVHGSVSPCKDLTFVLRVMSFIKMF